MRKGDIVHRLTEKKEPILCGILTRNVKWCITGMRLAITNGQYILAKVEDVAKESRAELSFYVHRLVTSRVYNNALNNRKLPNKRKLRV